MINKIKTGIDVIKSIEELILAQNIELIKNIATLKKWDADELINQFLIIPKKQQKIAKRGRGRPPGAKNSIKKEVKQKVNTEKKRGRGRPPGSKNKKKKNLIINDDTIKKRGRGRPKKRILEEVHFDSILEEEGDLNIGNFSQSSEEEIDMDSMFNHNEQNKDYEEVVCKQIKIKNEEYLHDPQTNNIYQNQHNNMFLGKLVNGEIDYAAQE